VLVVVRVESDWLLVGLLGLVVCSVICWGLAVLIDKLFAELLFGLCHFNAKLLNLIKIARSVQHLLL